MTECQYTPAPVRERRQAEAEAFGKETFHVKAGGVIDITVARTDYLSDSLQWGSSFQVYDPASVLPRG